MHPYLWLCYMLSAFYTGWAASKQVYQTKRRESRCHSGRAFHTEPVRRPQSATLLQWQRKEEEPANEYQGFYWQGHKFDYYSEYFFADYKAGLTEKGLSKSGRRYLAIMTQTHTTAYTMTSTNPKYSISWTASPIIMKPIDIMHWKNT